MTDIIFERRPEAAHAFFVLAHLDLGRDAANLHDDTLPEHHWVEPLKEAYAGAPGRLSLHALPLRSDWPTIVTALRTAPPRSLSDDRGRALASRFADAWDATNDFVPTWARPPTDLVAPLQSLRLALWERVGPPPPLTILDVEPLGPHARAIEEAGRRIVATSLAEPLEHALCQIFHEEVHASSDPLVRVGREHEHRDTAVGRPGYALHADLERTAIEVGQAIIEARAPELLGAYARWRDRFGL